MDENKFKKIGYDTEDIEELEDDFRLYTEYIWEIKEDFWLQQDDHKFRREVIQKALDKDPTIFTKEELLRIKSADEFILEHLQDAVRWFHNPRTLKGHPNKHWWRYVKYIAEGKMPKPDLDKIWEEYFKKVEEEE